MIERARRVRERAAQEPVAVGGAPRLAIAGVSHRYPGGRSAVQATSSGGVARRAGVVITGTSGTGKTTLLNALLGFVEPTPARVCPRRDHRRDDGPDATGSRGSARIRHGQRQHRRWSSVRAVDASDADAVRCCSDAAAGGTNPAAASAMSGGPVGPVNAAGWRSPGHCCGCRTVPIWLVLDEPTAGLDAATETALLDALGADVTILAVSHRPAVIARADRVLNLELPG
ncbi:MAG: hypothetical protein R2719_04065 [Micropruina sp.]